MKQCCAVDTAQTGVNLSRLDAVGLTGGHAILTQAGVKCPWDQMACQGSEEESKIAKSKHDNSKE